MRIKKLSEVLAKAITAGVPILLTGAPGVGKTDVITQAATIAGAKLIVLHPVVSDPTDFKGMPAVVEGEGCWLPFGELKELIEATELTVAFVDDLGQAAPMVQSAVGHVILARQIAGHKISDKVIFMAATNRRQDKSGVTAIMEHVKSRFASIINLDVHVGDWCEWAMDAGIDPRVIAFARFKPGYLTDPGAPTTEIVNRPSPRTVHQFARLLGAGIDDLESLSGATGPAYATEFLAFARIYTKIQSVQGIYANPKTAEIPTEYSTLHAITTAVSAAATKQTARAAMTYLLRLPAEFRNLGMMDIKRRVPACVNTPEYLQWAERDQVLHG